jgi:hypothetical protein
LPAGYDEISIRARLSGEMKFEPKPLRETGASAPKLLIDIQAKLQEGYGKGFENWAKVENIKRSAKTLMFIQDSGIDSYEELEQKCKDACGEMLSVNDEIKTIESKQKDINEFQKQIGTYGKTRAVLQQYNAIKNPKEKQAFYNDNSADIIRCRAAKKYFDEHGYKTKLPSVNSLKLEWAELEKDKRALYTEYKRKKKTFTDLCTAKSNAHKMLGLDKRRVNSRGHDVAL